ncbi:MAG: Cytochrome oxidase maturation protein cbb3-type [Pseudomonadota bacterium]
MNIVFLLLPIALVLGAAFAVLFIRAVHEGQFDDLDDAPQRMLRDGG